jgi:hypothetical protein
MSPPATAPPPLLRPLIPRQHTGKRKASTSRLIPYRNLSGVTERLLQEFISLRLSPAHVASLRLCPSLPSSRNKFVGCLRGLFALRQAFSSDAWEHEKARGRPSRVACFLHAIEATNSPTRITEVAKGCCCTAWSSTFTTARVTTHSCIAVSSSLCFRQFVRCKLLEASRDA